MTIGVRSVELIKVVVRNPKANINDVSVMQCWTEGLDELEQMRPVSVLAQVVQVLSCLPSWLGSDDRSDIDGILGKDFELGYELPKPIMFEVIAGVGAVVFQCC